MEICGQHGDLLNGLGDMREDIGEIREAVRTLKEMAKQNRDNIANLGISLHETNGTVNELNNTVRNGLSSKVDRMCEIVERREMERKTGIHGWLSDSWHEFSRKAGMVIFILAVWSLLWTALKTSIFKELPHGLFSGQKTHQEGVQSPTSMQRGGNND